MSIENRLAGKNFEETGLNMLNDVTPLENWIWYGNAGHLCFSSQCRFHLMTEIGAFFVSTVGEYIASNELNIFSPISSNPPFFYETIVFKINSRCTGDLKGICGGCSIPIGGTEELLSDRYLTAKEANTGHLEMCYKISGIKKETEE